MLGYLTLIFLCQLIGESIVSVFEIPVPGPVLGMAILFVGLLFKGALPKELNRTANALVSNLALLFVPAGVGILLHIKLIGSDLIPISVSLVASTLLTIAVTAITMTWLDRSSQDEAQGGCE
ncbi:MAG: CidA/LrgA family protein [Thalassobaculaceae bacterium]